MKVAQSNPPHRKRIARAVAITLRIFDCRSMKLALGIMCVCLGMSLAFKAEAADQSLGNSLPAPKGLEPCSQSDAVAVAETRVAENLGGSLLSCFHSGREIALQSTAKPALTPFEYAFAIRLAGEGYASGDVDKLLTTATGQWKDFQPLSSEFHDRYIARLNALMNEVSANQETISSIKPVLVSIKRLDAKSYSVVSIRSYVVTVSGTPISTVKVNADAIVLRGQNLIRLTMQRTLAGAADVADLQAEVAEWARAAE